MNKLFDLLRAAGQTGQGYVNEPLLDEIETKMEEHKVTGYWFSEKDELPNGDGRKVIIGETLSVEGKLALCSKGLHASLEPFDALTYAPESACLLYKVVSFGGIIHDEDKYCSRHRTANAVIDATDLLREFACTQALRVAHLWEMPEIVRQYLTTRREDIRLSAYRAAADAAADAARAVAYAATANAAAAYAAADAATNAACVAAYAAARAAANAASPLPSDPICAAVSSASAASAAVSSAAYAAARKEFNEMVEAAFDRSNGESNVRR